MKSFFQSVLGSLLALVLFAGGVFVFFLIMAASMGPKPPTVPAKAVLVFDLNRTLPDKPVEPDPATAIQNALQGVTGVDTPLPALIKALDKAADDPKISGMFITGSLKGGGAAALLELREALDRFRDKKPVLAYNQTWGRSELYLCAGLGEIIINPFGTMDIMAPAANLTFFANAFKKYGIEVQVTKVGKYKSAVEPFIQDKMSPENREQVKAFLEEIWNEQKNVIAKGRGLEPARIQYLADTKAALIADEAIEEKIADKKAHYDEVLGELKKMAGKEPDVKDFPQIDIDTYTKVPGIPQKGKNRIAIVVAQGDIVDGEGSSDQIGGDSLARELRALRMNKDVKAVVLRVNSPGGSALASEIIQREVIALKNAGKPVVVSMGNLAASGGYWISTYADRIFAEPTTITGSIGVFGMLPNAKKLANDHGITVDSVQLGKIGMPSLLRPLTPEEKNMVQALVDYCYEMFLDKVSESRNMDRNVVNEIAQGRVWAGRKALELGLVDELGNLDAAVKHAAKLAKIEDNYRIDAPGAPKPPIERFMEMMGGKEKKKLVKAGPLDAAQNELESTIRTLRSLNDPNGIYALAPIGVTIK